MSARRRALLARRQAPADAPAYPCPPELLHPCYVEEWLDAEDSVLSAGGKLVRGWGRWRRARQAFAEAQGLSELKACGPVGGPQTRR